MKMNESYLHVKIWMNLTKITVSKRVYTALLHLHKLQKQVKLMVVLQDRRVLGLLSGDNNKKEH